MENRMFDLSSAYHFPDSAPNPTLTRLHMCGIGPHILCGFGHGNPAAELCAQEKQMSGNILAHSFPPSPSIDSISNFLD